MSVKTIILIALGLGFLYGLFTIGFPFLLAIIIAIFLEPLIQLLMKYGRMKRIASATLICSLFTLGIMLLIYLLGLKLISELIQFLLKLPQYLDQANVFFQETLQKTQLFYANLPADVAAQIQKGTETALSALINSLNSLLGAVSGAFLDFAKTIPNLFIFLVVFIVALYLFSFSLPTLKGKFLMMFENRSQGKVEEVLLNLRNAIFGFIRAQLLISALTYVVTLFGLIFLKVDFAVAIAFLIIVVDILPILGTGSVLIPWAAYQFVTGDSYLSVGLLILYLAIIVFRRLVEPKILGDSIGISPLSALISMYVGFKLVGIVGLFLGPIVVIIYQAMQKVGLLNIKIKLE